MNSFWNQSPIIRALIPFGAGITIMVNFPFYHAPLPYFCAGLLVLLLVLRLLIKSPALIFSRINGVLFTLLLFLCGLTITQEKTISNEPEFMGRYADTATQWLVYVNDPPVPSEKTYKVPVNVQGALIDSNWQSTTGKAILYIEKDPQAAAIKYGDLLAVENRLEPLEGPQNPNEFNYKKYLTFHNIHHRGYIPAGSYRNLDKNVGNPFFSRIYDLRAHLLSIIRTTFVHEQSIAVAGALLIGYRDLLDRETIRNYSGTGAMHVLAVSGLHVGIIFLFLQQILPAGISKQWYQRITRPLFFLAGIWLYAVLTGLSPSVSRAATMFSFIIIGTIIDRPLKVYNSIAASAFFLLAIDPYILTEIGFLLSYFAVIGIVYIQPKIYRLLYFRNWLLDKAWAITCVSVAAQIATFPIGILFFYQFPVFFFISNLVVIPAAMIIVMGGMSLFVFSAVPSLKAALGFLLSWAIWLLNYIIAAINEIPFSLLDGIVVNIPQTVFIYLMIIFLILFLVHNELKWLHWSFTAAIILGLLTGFYSIDRSEHQSITAYAINGQSAVAVINGKEAVVLADSALLADEAAIRFNMLHHWWNKGVRNPTLKTFNKLPSAIAIGTATDSLVITSTVDSSLPPAKWILVRNNPWINDRDVEVLARYDQVIMDESNSYQSKRYWKRMLDSHRIAYIDLAEKGAFTWTEP